MNKSNITREGWHVTHQGFRYYVEDGRIIYGIANFDDGTELRMYQYKVRYSKSGEVFDYKRITPLATYGNIKRYVWRSSTGGE